jgi:endo-1,4-beta-D-glucanase Y
MQRNFSFVGLFVLGAGLFACEPTNSSVPPPGAGGSANAPATGGTSGAMPGTGGTAGTMTDECANAPAPMPSPPAAGANFPFPQNRLGACAYPMRNCLQKQNQQIIAAYDYWKSKWVTASGAGGNLRVQRDPFNNNDTVSEGIAYGMLLAVYLNDRPTFDGLWAYAKAHMNGNGFMHWRVDASGNVTGQNGATDSDEDMAWALIMAGEQWGSPYGGEGVTLIQKIMQHEVEQPSMVLKPGDAFGGSNQTNPSYFAPGYYRMFARVDTANATKWTQVAAKSYDVLTACRHPSTGLVPDWCTAAGQPHAMGINYTYDACRTPWRIAVDACLYPTGDARSAQYLNLLSTFFSQFRVTAIAEGYRVDGTAISTKYGSMAFVGPAGAAAMARTDGSLQEFLDNAQASIAGNSVSTGGVYTYYNGSWALLSMLLMSGNFVDFTLL